MLQSLAKLIILFIISTGAVFAAVQPLPVDQAFNLNGTLNNHQLTLQWKIAPGYYLYKTQFAFKPTKANTIAFGKVDFPQGDIKKDLLHGTFQSYSKDLTVNLPLDKMAGHLGVVVSYQGCSSQGFCYPPMKKILDLNVTGLALPSDVTANFISGGHKTLKSFSSEDQSYATQVLSGHHLFLVILAFLGLGLLLAFTPCVLPMVPILSSIIAGQGKNISTKKAFFLSLAYVLGMALTYAAAGVAVALVGSNIQIALQKPVVIAAFSGLFVLLALSLFGLYEIRLPNALQQRIVSHSNRLKGGALFSVFLMGAISTLIVSPCVSAPLVGVLAYIGKSGDVLFGALALLSLGIGMGIPLLVVGMFEGKFLPKAGMWMDKVKQFFGFLMLGLAIYLLQRVLQPAVIVCLWGVLAVFLAIFIWKITHSKRILSHLNKTLGLALLSYGFILVAGAMLGNGDPFSPWKIFTEHAVQQKINTTFIVVDNMQTLDRQLAIAKDNNKKVLLDFYADWCTSCVMMDHQVFNQDEVLSALKDFVVLRADVTKDDAFDKALMARYQVIAPPTMVFFNSRGNELPASQIVGEVNSKDFLTDLARLQVDEKLKYCQGDTRTC